MKKEQDLLDIYFREREEDMTNLYKEDRKYFEPILKKTGSKQVKSTIEQLPEEYQDIKEKLKKELEDITINYDIKLAYYNKKYYKQGFEDAIYLNKECNEKQIIKDK